MNIVEDGSPRIAFGSYNVYGQKMRRADGKVGNLGRVGGEGFRQNQADLMLEEFNRHKVRMTMVEPIIETSFERWTGTLMWRQR